MHHMIHPLLVKYLNTISNTCLIYQDNICLYYPFHPNKLFEKGCIKYGSDYLGRLVSFSKLLDVKQKACPLVDKETSTIYMPTHAIDSDECIWINFSKIKFIIPYDYMQTKIIFEGDFEYIINVDIRIIRKQIDRCYEYLSLIKN